MLENENGWKVSALAKLPLCPDDLRIGGWPLEEMSPMASENLTRREVGCDCTAYAIPPGRCADVACSDMSRSAVSSPVRAIFDEDPASCNCTSLIAWSLWLVTVWSGREDGDSSKGLTQLSIALTGPNSQTHITCEYDTTCTAEQRDRLSCSCGVVEQSMRSRPDPTWL